MIVASVHDPAIFSPESLAQNGGHLFERLRTMLHGHLLVMDDEGVMGRAMQEYLSTNVNVQMMVNAVFRNERILRVPVVPERRDRISQWVGTNGSAEAVAVSTHEDVDICVTDSQTLDAAKEENFDLARLTTLGHYHETEAWKRENLIFGGTPLSEFTKKDFLDKIVEPVVHWATSLTIIDKMIGISAFGKYPSGIPESNWRDFNETLKIIFDKWNSGPFSRKYPLTIVTEAITSYMKDGKPVLGNDLAAELAQRVKIPDNRVRILLKSHDDVKDLNHDRYLRTNNDFVIGFSRGFDMCKLDKKLRNADVYLRQAQASNDIITELINGRNVGVYPAKS
jgi:hypothetical protein